MTTQKSSSVPSVDYTPPYSNCRYKLCDLPGQCRKEGKCHHPRRAEPSPAEVSSEKVVTQQQAMVLAYEAIEYANSIASEPIFITAMEALSQQSPATGGNTPYDEGSFSLATVEGELTFDIIEELLPEGVLANDGGMIVSAQMLHDFAYRIERALNQRLAVNEGEAVAVRVVAPDGRVFLHEYKGQDVAHWATLNHSAELLYTATPRQEAHDPMEWPLPCDIKIGSGTIKAGVHFKTLLLRLESLDRLWTDVIKKDIQSPEAQALRAALRNIGTITPFNPLNAADNLRSGKRGPRTASQSTHPVSDDQQAKDAALNNFDATPAFYIDELTANTIKHTALINGKVRFSNKPSVECTVPVHWLPLSTTKQEEA